VTILAVLSLTCPDRYRELANEEHKRSFWTSCIAKRAILARCLANRFAGIDVFVVGSSGWNHSLTGIGTLRLDAGAPAFHARPVDHAVGVRAGARRDASDRWAIDRGAGECLAGADVADPATAEVEIAAGRRCGMRCTKAAKPSYAIARAARRSSAD